MYNPTVGDILYLEFMKPNNLNTMELSKSIGVQYNRISNIINNKSKVTEFLDKKLCKRFGTSDGYWLRLQELYDEEEKRKKL